MQELRVSIVQTNIIWENKQENLRLLRDKLQMLHGTTEIVVLPEMFSTGFSMNSRKLAEPIRKNHTNTQKVGRRISVRYYRKFHLQRTRFVL